MFCKNCGAQLEDGVMFCPKCGTSLSQSQSPVYTGAPSSQPKEQDGQRSWELPSLGGKAWMAAGGAAVLLLLGIVLGVSLGGRTSREEDGYAGGSKVVAEAKEQEHDITTLHVSSEILLEGRYGNLKSITVSLDAEGSVSAITYKDNASFPVLETLECGAILKVSDSGDKGYFDERDFPQLKSVTMKTVNKYIDEDVAMTYLIFSGMYEDGSLQSFHVENSHTIEDLYGTWTDENQTLSLTFEKSGMLRVADANNVIGVDAFKYQEIDDNTLGLSADQSGLLGRLSISMEYDIFGDLLQVRFLGQEFALTRK